MVYLKIVFNIPVSGSYTYKKPKECDYSLVGCRVTAVFGRRKAKGIVIEETDGKGDKYAEKARDITSLIDDEPICSLRHIKLAEWMSAYYYCSLGEALFASLPAGEPYKRERKPEVISEKSEDFLTLSEEQQNAYNEISASFSSSKPKAFLLHGVTGSGKTEIYLRIVRDVLERGKQAIVLIPEISLTPQTINRFRSRFKENIAVLHSRLSPKDKYSYWKKILKGEIRLIIGARSAVFSPTINTGVIIIDEEHESSYKSGESPRFHARQIAFQRMKEEKIPIILGSATPSVETYYHAISGNLRLLTLKNRPQNIKMPSVQIIDMKNTQKCDTFPLMSTTLYEKSLEALEKSEQIILFLNRKGYSPVVSCTHCGAVLTCPNCSVTLTYHKSRKVYLCHYCGYGKDVVDKCEECNIGFMKMAGTGTERVEEDISLLFPEYKIARMDQETTKKQGSYEKILDSFSKGEANILIGTQMISKGLHFPNVTLVGILHADTTLNFPDFRAPERVFNLITQVSGRSGRSNKGGSVYLQTYQPSHYAIKNAAKHDFESFYKAEIPKREALKYPPFSRVLRLVIRGENEEKVIKDIEALASAANRAFPPSSGVMVVGPAPCVLERLKKYYRWNIIFKTKKLTALSSFIGTIKETFKTKFGNYLEIDVDALDML